ncbi:M23 family metallopeptidase, partial [bacterium]|nr:M23 family metallopeptidase [bacterium]
STGRSTGPHLDWRMYWGPQRIDPALLVPPMTTSQESSQ